MLKLLHSIVISSLLFLNQFTVPMHTGATAATAGGSCASIGVGCSDAFTGSSLSGNWTVIFNSFVISTGTYTGNAHNDNALASYTAATFTPNQQSCAVISGFFSTNVAGVGVRMDGSATSNYNGYFAAWQSPNLTLQKFVGGAFTSLSSTTTTTGHTICINAHNTTISVTDNGSTVLSVTDTSIASGHAGIFAWNDSFASTGSLWTGVDIP